MGISVHVLSARLFVIQMRVYITQTTCAYIHTDMIKRQFLSMFRNPRASWEIPGDCCGGLLDVKVRLCMYVCVYVCMYVCMYACMYVCMPLIAVAITVSMPSMTCVCMYVCMCVCMYVCKYSCMYVCMYIQMYVCCMYKNLLKCVYSHTHICTHTHTHTNTNLSSLHQRHIRHFSSPFLTTR